MAERRMFAKSIIDSDLFIDMPTSARLLYYDLSMRADDEGFIDAPKKIVRMTGASEDDLKILILKQFVIPFDSGVVVIKHWRIHNYIQGDRKKQTLYTAEKAQLTEKCGTYVLKESEMKEYLTNEPCIQTVDTGDGNTVCIQTMDTQDRLGKVRLGKDRIEENRENEDRLDNILSSGERSAEGRGDADKRREEEKTKGFVPPTVEEVAAYCAERNNNVDAEIFVDFYTSKGWMVGKNKMKDWKAAVRTWERNRNEPRQKKSGDDVFDFFMEEAGL